MLEVISADVAFDASKNDISKGTLRGVSVFSGMVARPRRARAQNNAFKIKQLIELPKATPGGSCGVFER
jgi:hypothetical protein